MSLNLLLQVLALVMLIIATYKLPEPVHLSYGWCGMALWMLTIVFGGIKL